MPRPNFALISSIEPSPGRPASAAARIIRVVMTSLEFGGRKLNRTCKRPYKFRAEVGKINDWWACKLRLFLPWYIFAWNSVWFSLFAVLYRITSKVQSPDLIFQIRRFFHYRRRARMVRPEREAGHWALAPGAHRWTFRHELLLAPEGLHHVLM